MKKITDDTLVKIKVPRKLYESMKKKMALKENYEEGMKPKEEGKIEESLMDILASANMETLGMIATALGITGGAAKLASMIKQSGSQPGGSTGVYIDPKNKGMGGL